MKSKELWFGRWMVGVMAAGLFAGGIFVTRASAQVDLSLNLSIQSPGDFYSPLAPYGSWVNVNSYGRCWRPADVPVGWRPYSLGQWEWTDAGWYWVSDEPWGWACFHYGQWIMDPVYGWVWMPGTQWAPAWVVWRETPDYIGWAPCGPGGAVFSDDSYNFVNIHHFHDRLRPRELVFNDPGIFRRSRVVGGFRTETRDWGGVSRRIAVNQGPRVARIQRATGTRFTQRPVRELVQQTAPAESVRRTTHEGVRQQPYLSQQPQQRATQQNQQRQERLYREAPTQPPAPTGRQQPRIYREAPNRQPATQTSPTGRQEPRVYPEVPTPQPAPQPAPTRPTEPRQRYVPEASAPTAVPRARALPPAERGMERPEAQVRRRAEQPPRAVEPAPRTPEPAPRVAPEPPRQAPAQPPNTSRRHEGKDHHGDE